jgi:hypothetical protein
MAPARKLPTKLTTNVPQGNVSPYCRATKPESQYRTNVPTRPAKAMNIVFCTEQVSHKKAQKHKKENELSSLLLCLCAFVAQGRQGSQRLAQSGVT